MSIKQDIERVSRKIGEFKQSGGELVFKVCPFCKPVEKDNYHTFKMSAETGLYKCHRGKCGESGNLDKLYRKILNTERNKSVINPVVKDKPLQKISESLSPKVIEYLKSRSISPETARKAGVTCDIKGVNLCFSHIEDGKVITQKFRNITKKDFYVTGRTKNLSLWQIHKVDINQPLIITEGEIDTLTLFECGYTNAVSVPQGSNNNDWLTKDIETLEKISDIIFWNDNDKPGIEQKGNVVQRLGKHKVRIVQSDYKDANEAFRAEGVEYIHKCIFEAKREPLGDFVQAHKITGRIDWKDCEKLRTGIPELDNKLGGGLPMFAYTVLSGITGSGKTSFVNNLVISAINQGYRTLYFSGEIEAEFVINELEKIVAGRKNIYESEVTTDIREYFEANTGRMLLINPDSLYYTSEQLLNKIEDAFKMHAIRVFVIDNLMKVRFAGCRSLSEQLEKQDDFCHQLDMLAKKYRVQIIIVQHPKKLDGKSMMVMDDIRGSGRVMDTASNVIIVHRMDEEFKEKNFTHDERAMIQGNALISVEKSRYQGEKFKLALNFCKDTGRFVKEDFENDNPRLMTF